MVIQELFNSIVMRQHKVIEQSILKTLAYADLFDWPIKENEVFLKAQSAKLKTQNYSAKLKTKKEQFKSILRKLVKENRIGEKDNFYFLPERKNLVKQRLQKEKWAVEKMRLAEKRTKWLKIFPSVLLVGVSGGLAVSNVDKDDDIDFFVICKVNTLWTTRFLVTLLFDFLGWRRKPRDKKFKDKICLNMFVDEIGMGVPAKERDLFTAHEVGQMRPLWERGVYGRFLGVNSWVKDFLPSLELKAKSVKRQRKSKNFKKFCALSCSFSLCALSFALSLIENFLRWLQLKYMAGKRTKEKIEAHRLLFHPEDKRKVVMRGYKQKLKKLKL